MGDIDEGFEDDHDCPGTSCLRCAGPMAKRICDHKSHPWPCGLCWELALVEQKKRYDEAVARLDPKEPSKATHLLANQLWNEAVAKTTVQRAERERLVRNGTDSLVTACQERVLAEMERVARLTSDKSRMDKSVYLNLDNWFGLAVNSQYVPIRQAITEAAVFRLKSLCYTVEESKRTNNEVCGLNLGGWR